MNPTVVAAWIAAGVSGLTLVGTVLAQFIGYRSTRKNAEQQIKATHQDTAAQIAAANKTTADTLDQQRKQFEPTLAEQRGQLGLTLAEQSRQLERTLGEQRTRTWNERFATAAGQLGSDKPSAVRLAGVYGMAGLADDWEANRQTCVDVLCAYLRMPYEPDPGEDSPMAERLAFRAGREVRHTVIRVIAAHLQDDVAVSWQGLDLDFTGVIFDGGSFGRARFSGDIVSFGLAEFSGVGDAGIDFWDAEFAGRRVSFYKTKFPGDVDFYHAKFSSGTVDFHGAEFSGGKVGFSSAEFSGGEVGFSGAKFSGGEVHFGTAEFFDGQVTFMDAEFSGAEVDFRFAKFSGGTVDFLHSKFSGGEVDFALAKFSGGTVDLGMADFSGGTVDFSNPGEWSHPPTFPWTDAPDAPPPYVNLPSSGSLDS